MTRLTQEREQEIREDLFNGYFHGSDNVEALLAELDAVRAERDAALKQLKATQELYAERDDDFKAYNEREDRLRARCERLLEITYCEYETIETTAGAAKWHSKTCRRCDELARDGEQNAVMREALLQIYDEPNQLGVIADELCDEHDIKAWNIARAALEKVGRE